MSVCSVARRGISHLSNVHASVLCVCVCLFTCTWRRVRVPVCVSWSKQEKQLFRCWADYWMSFLRRATRHTPLLSLSAVLQGSLQMTECFCPALWNRCHIPFRRTAQQQRSLHVEEHIGKRHRQNCGGKRPLFVPSAVDYQKSCILDSIAWPCLFVYGCSAAAHASICLFWKGKRYNLFPHTGSGLATAISGKILAQASVETEGTSLFCQEVLLSGVDNAPGQASDCATLKWCWIPDYWVLSDVVITWIWILGLYFYISVFLVEAMVEDRQPMASQETEQPSVPVHTGNFFFCAFPCSHTAMQHLPSHLYLLMCFFTWSCVSSIW